MTQNSIQKPTAEIVSLNLTANDSGPVCPLSRHKQSVQDLVNQSPALSALLGFYGHTARRKDLVP